MSNRSIVILLAMSSLALAGCGGAPEPVASPLIPTLSESASPTPTPVAALPESIVLGGDHWEIRDTSGVVTSSIAYTEPVSVVLEGLTEVFGDDYSLSEYLGDDGCGQNPAHIYSWGQGEVGLADRTGFTDEPLHEAMPYGIFAGVPRFDGVRIVSTGGMSVGDDVSALPAANDPSNGTGVILLEGGGTYERVSGMGDGSTYQADWGLFALTDTETDIVTTLAAPATGYEFFC